MSPDTFALVGCLVAMVVFTAIGVVDRIRIQSRHARRQQEPRPLPPKNAALQVTLTVDPCCLEAIIFTISAASCAELLDRNQLKCCQGLIEQIGNQVPTDARHCLSAAAHYAARRHEDRQQQRLYQAIVVSPSRS